MSPAPDDWFRALGVDRDVVTRFGSSLATYAVEHESPEGRSDASFEELSVMQATTFAEAASLVVLVDPAAGRALFARAATLLGSLKQPDAWTYGIASRGAWQPSMPSLLRRDLANPTDVMAELVALYSEQQLSLDPRNESWLAAAALRRTPEQGWSAAGVPSAMFSTLADHARERDTEGIMGALDNITSRSDEVIYFAQDNDTWHWERFASDVPLIDPELVALGAVLSHLDGDIRAQLQDRHVTPARVAVLAGIDDTYGTDESDNVLAPPFF